MIERDKVETWGIRIGRERENWRRDVMLKKIKSKWDQMFFKLLHPLFTLRIATLLSSRPHIRFLILSLQVSVLTS